MGSRKDGRSPLQLRPLELEKSVLNRADGSSRLKASKKPKKNILICFFMLQIYIYFEIENR